MQYIPNTSIKNQMLKELKINSIEQLFEDIPKEFRIEKLNLPNGKTEMEVKKEVKEILKKNKVLPSFLGGGIYKHYIPSAVKSLVSRAEFYTSYTPYQPEVSQGFLQSMFEYQSLICELTGMDVANASLYDGTTALGEGALMCARINAKNEFIIPRAISFEKKSVLKNYVKGAKLKIKEINFNKDGKINLEELKNAINENTSGVYIENPNYFGIFEDEINKVKETIGKSLLVVGVNPISLGIVSPPSEYNADIVIGEGQCFGNPMNFGGPLLGIFSCKKEFLRQLPGRIVGLTKDAKGKRAFCLTLQTREQHIRRSKATSNICTNNALNSLIATIYLSLLGKNGFKKLAELNLKKANYLAGKICKINGFKKVFNSLHFNEFVIQSEKSAEEINKKLLQKGIQGGLLLEKQFPELKNSMLIATTEMHGKDDLDKFVRNLNS